MTEGTQIEPELQCRQCGEAVRGFPPGHRCPHDGAPMLRADVLARYPRDPLLGRVLGDKYALIDVLGTGGFGAVYLALQAPLDRPVAVKVIRREADHADPSASARFFQEARTVARLEHECIVTLYDYGEAPEDGLLYMVMERVKGHTLKAEMERKGTLSPDRVMAFALNILGALAAAHKQGVVHRDLKPDNVMISEGALGEERVRVLDFGIAKMLEGYGEAQRQMTQHGLVLGTPRYMAPEVATRRGPRPQSDLYALGVMIFEMLTGHPPFTGRTGFEIMQAHVRQPLPELALERDLPTWLIPVLERTLAKAPEDRWPDARAMAVALKTAVPTPRADLPSLSLIPALTTSALDALNANEAPTTAARPVAQPVAPPAEEGERRTRVESLEQVPLQEVGTAEHQPTPIPAAPSGDTSSTTSRELMGESTTTTAEGVSPPGPRWVKWAIAGGIASGLLVGSLLTMEHLGTSSRIGAASRSVSVGALVTVEDAGAAPHRVVLGTAPADAFITGQLEREPPPSRLAGALAEADAQPEPPGASPLGGAADLEGAELGGAGGAQADEPAVVGGGGLEAGPEDDLEADAGGDDLPAPAVERGAAKRTTKRRSPRRRKRREQRAPEPKPAFRIERL